MINKQFVIIPYWVENVLNRNNIDLIDILNYPKLSAVLSLDDLAQLNALQTLEESKTIKELTNGQCLFSSWRQSTQESQWVELDSALYPLSCSKDLRRDLVERLSLEFAPMSYDTHNSTLPKYKIVDLNRDITLFVLNPGFIDFEFDKINFFTIISDLLKSLYVYHTTSEVSSYQLFSKYIQLLEDDVRK